MNKALLSVAALLAVGATSASAADLPAKVYTKAPPIVAVDPWDIAFGTSISSEYVFRGITQSNHQPSVTGYFEPRYNINPNLQLYAGVSASSISFTNRAAVEIDGYAGIRPTFGPVAFDFGFWYYGYPGGQCIDYVQGGGVVCPLGSSAIFNGNAMKKDVSFYEVYGKVNYTFNDVFTAGASVNYSPDFLRFGTEGTYAAVNAKITMPSNFFGTSGIGSYISGEYGRQWLGTTDAFYLFTALPDYNTWNVGVGFTYKVFTLDLRYTDTDLSKGGCQAITSDFTSNGVTSNWCGARFVAKLSADLSLASVK
ncbi:TorF family putative porin [Rhodopseudomonas sp. HC1]|uniref:TorF family putative porin n=1 Tax=Rhodopseudomonas infernalis TaxID=2897386 RepID=UPI001EE78ADE|nr:TorF family putative porin [Rhodopseudomonas infernalis]MCG6207121.1 TorF family putative porin [Rhodopseudomonas infernalis]